MDNTNLIFLEENVSNNSFYNGIQSFTSFQECEAIIENICQKSIIFYKEQIKKKDKKESLIDTAYYIKEEFNLSGSVNNLDKNNTDELSILVFQMCILSYRHIYIVYIVKTILTYFDFYFPSENNHLKLWLSHQEPEFLQNL